VVILTHVVKERAMNAAIARIEALPAIRTPVNRIRVESLA
jgi:homoserine dehydrogenase